MSFLAFVPRRYTFRGFSGSKALTVPWIPEESASNSTAYVVDSGSGLTKLTISGESTHSSPKKHAASGTSPLPALTVRTARTVLSKRVHGVTQLTSAGSCVFGADDKGLFAFLAHDELVYRLVFTLYVLDTSCSLSNPGWCPVNTSSSAADSAAGAPPSALCAVPLSDLSDDAAEMLGFPNMPGSASFVLFMHDAASSSIVAALIVLPDGADRGVSVGTVTIPPSEPLQCFAVQLLSLPPGDAVVSITVHARDSLLYFTTATSRQVYVVDLCWRSSDSGLCSVSGYRVELRNSRVDMSIWR